MSCSESFTMQALTWLYHSCRIGQISSNFYWFIIIRPHTHKTKQNKQKTKQNKTKKNQKTKQNKNKTKQKTKQKQIKSKQNKNKTKIKQQKNKIKNQKTKTNKKKLFYGRNRPKFSVLAGLFLIFQNFVKSAVF